MKKFLLLWVVLFSFSAVVHAQNQLVMDENAEPATLPGAFNAIRVTDGIDVFISQSDEIAMAVSAGKDCGKSIRAVVEDSVLNISFQGAPGCPYLKRRVNVYISFKELNALRISNGSSVTLFGDLIGNVLNLRLSAGSNFKGSFNIQQMNVQLSGGSDAKLSGKAKSLNIETSGASDVKAYGLSADTCLAIASGASDILISVNHLIKANASGASDIYYKGDASLVKLHNSGASTIKKQD